MPVHAAAKIYALCDLYPNKSRTEIVGDLLVAALEELIPNLPREEGSGIDHDPEIGTVREIRDAALQFQNLANKHYKDLERELGNEGAADLY